MSSLGKKKCLFTLPFFNQNVWAFVIEFYEFLAFCGC